MKSLGIALISIFLLCSTVESCPLEPNPEFYEASWALDKNLGVLIRYKIDGKYWIYAHPRLISQRGEALCHKGPNGECKTIVMDEAYNEIFLIDIYNGISYKAMKSASMCLGEGGKWESFKMIGNYEGN